MSLEYLAALGVVTPPVCVTVHTCSEWHQSDGSSCGLFTLITLISLAEGRCLSIDLHQPYMRLRWRKHFAASVLQAIAPQ